MDYENLLLRPVASELVSRVMDSRLRAYSNNECLELVDAIRDIGRVDKLWVVEEEQINISRLAKKELDY